MVAIDLTAVVLPCDSCGKILRPCCMTQGYKRPSALLPPLIQIPAHSTNFQTNIQHVRIQTIIPTRINTCNIHPNKCVVKGSLVARVNSERRGTLLLCLCWPFWLAKQAVWLPGRFVLLRVDISACLADIKNANPTQRVPWYLLRRY